MFGVPHVNLMDPDEAELKRIALTYHNMHKDHAPDPQDGTGLFIHLAQVTLRVVRRRVGFQLKVGLGSCAGREQGKHVSASKSKQNRVPRLQTYNNNMVIFIYIHNDMYTHARPLLCRFSPFLPRSCTWLASDLQQNACAHAELADTEKDKHSSVSKNEATARLEKVTFNTPALYLQ